MSKAQRDGEAKRRAGAATKAVIGFIHPGEVSGAFTDSLCRTLMAEVRPDGLLGPGGGYISVQSGPRIAEGRSQVVEAFLNADIYKAAEWLWMVDSDMVFDPDVLRRLVMAADKIERPILGGLCFAGSSPENCYPTLYKLVAHDGTWATEPVDEFPFDAMVKVGATGAACLLVHRDVLLRMYASFRTLPNGQPNHYPWFVEGHVDHRGRALGEDIAFCIRAQSMGIPVHVHTGIEVGHRKHVTLDTAVWKANRP